MVIKGPYIDLKTNKLSVSFTSTLSSSLDDSSTFSTLEFGANESGGLRSLLDPK